MNKKTVIASKSKKIVEVVTDCGISYGKACKMLREKDIKLNGVPCRENVKVEIGDEVTFFFADNVKQYEKVFESDNVLIVNKFSNIETETLASELNVFAVHRLDRNTEGLVVFAKTKSAKSKLDFAFKRRLVHKFYLTEVVGAFDVNREFVVFLVKDKDKSLVRICANKVEGAVKIKTKVRSLKVGVESSLLEVEIDGGKTHQIRAHLAYLGHAIIGDGKYGKREDYARFNLKKQRLFAYKLKFEEVGLDELNGKEFKILPEFVQGIKNLPI